MLDIVAHRVFQYDDVQAPGDFYIFDDLSGMLISCPCGCRDERSNFGITFNRSPDISGPKWNWNNNLDKPTLTPSIRRLSGCKWHGFLTDGIFKTCEN